MARRIAGVARPGDEIARLIQADDRPPPATAMKSDRKVPAPGPSHVLTGHRFERLIIFYSDADGLRRGFQFWMGWLGGADAGCDCVPIFLGEGQHDPRGCESLKSHCRKSLVLFCPPADETKTDDLRARVFAILAQDNASQRGLVVLLTDHGTPASWRWLGAPSAEGRFVLGRFTASPCVAADPGTASVGYDLRSLTPDASPPVGNGRKRAP